MRCRHAWRRFCSPESRRCRRPFLSRPVTIIVPFPAGGPVDTIGRIIAERMRTFLGQPVLIENVGGAAGSIGVGRAARAAPDGYTLSLGNWATHVVNSAIYPLNFDVLTDFDPVSLIVTQPEIVVARKTLPADDLKGLIAWLKANPGQGRTGDVRRRQRRTRCGRVFSEGHRHPVSVRALPRLGAGDAGPGGRSGGHADRRSSQLRAAGARRDGDRPCSDGQDPAAALPDVPTVDEAGLPGFYASVWYALWSPKDTPKAVSARLNAAVVDALADATVRQRLADLGMEIFPPDQQTPEVLRALHKAEAEKWWPIIKAANISAVTYQAEVRVYG